MKLMALLLAAFSIVSVCTRAHAQQQTFYVFRELEGTLGEQGQDQRFELGGRSCAYAINNDGVVVGSAERHGWNSQTGQPTVSTSEMAVLWATPGFSLGINGTTTSRAVDISDNDYSYVVTKYMSSSWESRGTDGWYGDTYAFTPGGSVRTMVTDPDGNPASPTAINTGGRVVANGLHGDNEDVSYLLTPTGEDAAPWNYQELGVEEAYGVNDLVQTIGMSWVDLWSDDDQNTYMSLHGYIGSTDLGHLWNPGPVAPGQEVPRAVTAPRGINDQGTVVGESSVAEDQGHAFIWRNGTMSDLGTLGGDESEAYAVNELNMVVGQATLANGDIHAFVYHDLVGMIDLNELAPSAAQDGLVLEAAYDINESGAIVGKARDEFGLEKGFLLTPGAFLAGASATGSFDPDGFDPADFNLDGLPDLFESLGGIIDLDDFLLLGTSATLSIPYDEAMLQALGVSEGDLRLFWYDEDNDRWILAGAQSNNLPGGSFVLGAPTDQLGDFGIDTEADLIWANIDHASTYGVFAIPEPATLALLVVGGLALVWRKRCRSR